MPTVILQDKAGQDVPISDTYSFVDAVYNRGWLPKAGTVGDNFAALYEAGPAPVEGVNEHVRLGDLQSSSSAASAALRAAFALGELAYAENITGTVTSGGTGALVDIPGTTITVPVCAQPVYLEAQMSVTVTAFTTAGHANAALAEISNGVDTPLLYGFATAVTRNSQTVTLACRFRIGPTARQRQFKLQIGLHSSTITAQAFNGAAAPTWLAARAR